MEPGHEDREYTSPDSTACTSQPPQWSPVMKTGNTDYDIQRLTLEKSASMEPGHEDREYNQETSIHLSHLCASMEPGHEDREYHPRDSLHHGRHDLPQWSPVMKTGNTGDGGISRSIPSMPQWSPVMKTGNTRLARDHPLRRRRLNGARS